MVARLLEGEDGLHYHSDYFDEKGTAKVDAFIISNSSEELTLQIFIHILL